MQISQLGWEGWLTLGVVVVTISLLVKDTVAPSIAILGANITLLIAGVISAEESLAGFSNQAVVTVAALFVVARAVEKTGAMQPLIRATLGKGGGRWSLLRLLAPVAGSSAFLNNTPIVAMLAPQVADWADKRGLPASRYLMPLSFATILGGVITVMGTSTNLVVSGLMTETGQAPIGMFELTKVGLPVAIVGVLTVVLTAPWVLPDRRTARRQFTDEFREFVCSAAVVVGGPLDGKTVESANLRQLEGVYLVEIARNGDTLPAPSPETVLHGGDVLTFAGRVDMVRDLQTMRGLVSTEHPHLLEFTSPQHTFFEVVVSGTSFLAGKSLKEADFRTRFQAAVLGIHRAGARVNEKLGSVPLKEGDTLLLISDQGFAKRWRDRSDFLLISRLGGSPPAKARHAILAGIITLAIVIGAGLQLIPMLNAALLGAVVLVLVKVITPGEARGSLDLDTLVVIAASFGIGAAIEASGLAAALAGVMVGPLQDYGPQAILLAVVLATVIITELITNNAAAALLFPIAMAAAAAIGADPRPFGIAIAMSASNSFLTPIGYQTNMMVYGPGGYRFTDYIRLGLPLTLIMIVVTVFVVPIAWPF